MDSRKLKLLAALTAVAALLFGYLAFQVSKERTPAPVARSIGVPADWGQAVVAVQPIEDGQTIAAEMVAQVPVQIAPAEGYLRIEDVVGKAPASAVGIGEPLLQRHFRQGSALAQKLAPNERAVAIVVNEVISVGGHLQAGDMVDVLTYLAADGRQVQNSQARVVLERLRVLAYGAQADGAGARGQAAAASKTAVLAVPAKDVTRLMLAANAGTLRLALHGGAPSTTTTTTTTTATATESPTTLRELGRSTATAAPRPAGPVIYRGGQKSRTSN